MSKEEARNDLFRTSASKIYKKKCFVPLNVDNRYLQMLQMVI
jgi:hypothetical protein